jgi:glycosyltransferase involved in cell wall biosynthesis
MNVAIVGGTLPYPANAGNRVRSLNLTLRLARRHRITYLHHAGDAKETRHAVDYLRGHGVETHEIPHSVPPKSGPSFYARLAANLASPLPYSVTTHGGAAVRRAVVAFAAEHQVELWQAEGSHYFDALCGLDGVRTVLMAHNVESLIWQRLYEAEVLPLRRWYIRKQWRKFERYERRICAAATRVVTVSREDATIVRNEFGMDRIDVVANGVDRTYFEAVPNNHREIRRILFLGSFEWRPNLDAVGLLLDRIFPVVRDAEPTAQLVLVGRNPPESLVRRVRDEPGVELHPNVPDVRPFLSGSGVMAVPLRIGGGSRLKILEAMATGLPVVSTRIGAEGLDLEAGWHFIAADTPEAHAAALLDVIRQPGPAQDRARRARQLVFARYDWDVLAEELEQTWMRCVEAPAGTVPTQRLV